MRKEQKRFANSKEKNCPWCGALNPPKGYACIKCFQVMSQKFKIPWWKVQIKSSVGMAAFIFVLFIVGAIMVKGWLNAVEAKMVIEVQNAEYQLSLSAGKVRKTTALKNSQKDQSENQFNTEESSQDDTWEETEVTAPQ